MFSLYDQQKSKVDRIVRHQFETAQQLREHLLRQNAWMEKIPKEQLEAWARQMDRVCPIFNDTAFIRPDSPIGIFMDYRKNKFALGMQKEGEDGAPLHRHNYFEMFYVYQGRCTSTIEGVEREFRAGDLCLYSLQAKHFCFLPSDEDVVFDFIIRKSAIDDAMLQMLSNSDVFSKFFIDSIRGEDRKTSMTFQVRGDNEISFYLLKMIITYFENPDGGGNLMRSLLACLFQELAGQYRQQADEQSRREQDGLSVSNVIQYIEQNYQSATLQQTAQHFYYSPRGLSNYLQKYTGKKFSQIVQEIRLKKACNLLKDPNIPLDSIPAIVGYSDRHYLDKLFRQSYGVSLSKFRKGLASSLSEL